MSAHLDTGNIGSYTKALHLPVPGDGQTSAASFQQYLDSINSTPASASAKKPTPEALRFMAANLISALDRASMKSLFFDTTAGADTSPATLVSTELFMAMRNNAIMSPPARAEQMSEQLTGQPMKLPVPVPAIMATDKPPAIQAALASDGSSTHQYAAMIDRAAAANDLDPKLIAAVVQTESNFNAQAVSPVGAQGLMQLMPGTAADLGVSDAFNPEQNIQAGSKYLKQLMERYHGDTGLALAAYNWGMGNLERQPERMPQETVNYVAKITALMRSAA